jgi:inner membrane protein
MDTLTHALSGALLGRALTPSAAGSSTARPMLGPTVPAWHAVSLGLVAAAFPDSDFVLRFISETAYLRGHRGITHSLLMLPLWSLLLGWLASRLFRRPDALRRYALVAGGAIAIHIAGDWITQFGTMLLAPVSTQRFGLGAMFIIDLSFSGLLLAGAALAALWPTRRWPAALGLLAASAWVVLAWVGQTEAVAVGERKVQALGLASSNSEIVVMPRPASPFNWTVSVFDGERYHVAHVNTRRSEPLNVGPDGNFIQRFSAPYQPERLLAWRVVPQFGDAATPAWVRQAWAAPGFDFFRWFAQTPALLSTTESEAVVNGQLSVERCAWFRDLRFEFPGREEGPFRYGVCRSEPAPAKPLGSSGASAQAVPGAIDRIFKLEGDQRIQVR